MTDLQNSFCMLLGNSNTSNTKCNFDLLRMRKVGKNYVHIRYLSLHLYETLSSSAGRASDCRSDGRRFESSLRDIYLFFSHVCVCTARDPRNGLFLFDVLFWKRIRIQDADSKILVQNQLEAC